MMATMGGGSPTKVAVEEIGTSTQREDMVMEEAGGVEALNSTAGDVLMTGLAPMIMTAAEPLECNENGKRLRSEAPKAPGYWRSRMEWMV
jgi:hypothetical protein